MNCTKSPVINSPYTGCPWTASADESWISLTGNTASDQQGAGTVPYSIDVNQGPARSGTITFSSGTYGSAQFTITQGTPCIFSSLTGSGLTVPPAGGNGSVILNFSNGPGCTWSLSAPSFVNWTAASSGTASGSSVTVPFNVAAYSGTGQSGNIIATVNGTAETGQNALWVGQDGSACAVTVNPTSANIPASGGNGSFTWGGNCPWWNDPNPPSWVSVNYSVSPVSYTVAANTGTARTAILTTSGPSNNATFTINQAAASTEPIAISCNPTNGPVEVGASYSSVCSANGGNPPYTWSVQLPIGCGINCPSPGIPAGVSLVNGPNPTGPTATISGTPTSPSGNSHGYTYNIQVADSTPQSPQTVSENFTGVVAPPPSVTAASLVGGTKGVAYSQTLQATGGTQPYSNWLVTSGALPPGLNLNASTGTISGTPSSSTGSPYSFSVTVKDSVGVTSGAQSFTITVTAPTATLSISCNPSTGPSEVGLPYSSTCSASGGTPPYKWSIGLPIGCGINCPSPGLPAGVSLVNGPKPTGATATISGTPTTPSGTHGYTYNVQVTDSTVETPQTVSENFAGSVIAAPTVTASSLPGGTIGQAYNGQALQATGGTSPYSGWTIAGGTLPPGLSLNASTGVIAGTPSGASATSAPYNFNVTVKDSAGVTSAAQAFTLSIAPAPSNGVTINTNPAGLQFTVDNQAPQVAPQTLNLSPGAHTIAVAVTQPGTTGTQYAFQNWSDGGGSSHTITVGSSPLSLTAAFQTQYLLTTGVSPAGSGTVAASPAPAGGYLNAGTSVQVSAAPAGGFQFSHWSGDLAGSVTPQTLAMNGPHAVTANFSTATAVTLNVAPASLAFNARSDGSLAPGPQSISVFGANPTAFTASASASGGNWLSISPTSGQTPGTVIVSVNPSVLSAGNYSGQVTISAPTASPSSVTIPVSITVTAVPTPQLSVSPSKVTMVAVAGGADLQQQLVVSNTGGGTLSFNASATGGNWLTLGETGGAAPSGLATALPFTLTLQGLSPGTYQGEIDLATSDGSQKASVPVTLAVNNQPQSIVLSQTGLMFQAIAQSGAPPSQTFSVLNGGVGTLNWTATPQTFGQASGWLSVTPGSGSSQSGAAAPVSASVSVNPPNLQPGTYYGEIVVGAGTAGNSPQIVSVVLTVLPSSSTVPPLLSTVGLVPVGPANGKPVDSTTVTNLSSQPASYTSTATTDDGGNWLVVSPANGTVAGGGSSQITVQVNTSGLTPGLVRTGTVRLGFSGQGVQTLRVVSAVTDSATSTPQDANPHTSSKCVPTSIGLAISTLEDGFSVIAGNPVPISAKIVDSCGNAVVSGAAVLVNFSNRDPNLSPVSDGSAWSATWTPQTASSSVKVTVTALLVVGQNYFGAQQVATGTVASAPSASAANENFVANSASYLRPGEVAAGSWVAIFGDRLADSQQSTDSAPFPPTLAGTQVLFGTKPLPLLYVSDSQVNALIPYSLTSSTNHPLQIVRDGTTSTPFDVTQADVLPAIYSADQTGSGQGAILIAGTASLAAPLGAYPGSMPVSAGQYIAIFANGLGPVQNTPDDGAAAPSTPPFSPTLTTPTVTIGGVQAPVIQYSGLAPGLVGLYQVNVQVPPGVAPGNAVPVVISVGGSTSNTVTIAVQ